jgi:hypothetical protein
MLQYAMPSCVSTYINCCTCHCTYHLYTYRVILSLHTGDINLVNGKPWPFHKVEPRAYRLAFLDASVSRPYSIKFIAETADRTEQVNEKNRCYSNFFFCNAL